MTMYCTRQQVIDRISLSGLLALVDDDLDDSADSAEQSVIDDSIQDVSSEIDSALVNWFDLPLTGTNADSRWLQAKAVDLATERIVQRKGGVVPESISDPARRSREDLLDVRNGLLRIPDLQYPIETIANEEELRQLGMPRVTNPDTSNSGVDSWR